MYYLKGTIGYLLTICISIPLFIEGYYILGAISMIGGLVIIDSNNN